jgi:hypothetical protein
MPDLNILAFTDFHGRQEAYSRASRLISTEKPDLVVVAGDLVNFDAERGKQFLLQLAGAGRPVYFVPGNMDNGELMDWAGNSNVHPLHGRCERMEGNCLIGLGGSPRGPFNSPFEFTETEATEILEKTVKSCRGDKLILVSHCPPKDTKIDRVSSGEHAGSVSVKEFVEKARPVLVISGHIHEAQGIDTVGLSTLVNPGPAQRGHFAKIVLKDAPGIAFGKLF